jgi:hypothetical protein
LPIEAAASPVAANKASIDRFGVFIGLLSTTLAVFAIESEM